MLAYLNDPSVKDKYLTRVRKHREADKLVQGYGYWNDGKGCAVGCTIHNGNHTDYEKKLGIPVRIAYLEDAIFEGLPVEQAQLWPERFLSAIKPGTDLSLVWNRFSLWLLTTSKLLTITDVNREAIKAVAVLHRRVIKGDEVSTDEWSAAAWSAGEAAWSAWAVRSAKEAAWAAWAARAAARSAEEAARSAARSAEEAARSAAWSARSARSAAWSAGEAAWSAEEAAEEAARSVAWIKMADKLVQLLKLCE